jgi:hypothetical protein
MLKQQAVHCSQSYLDQPQSVVSTLARPAHVQRIRDIPDLLLTRVLMAGPRSALGLLVDRGRDADPAGVDLNRIGSGGGGLPILLSVIVIAGKEERTAVWSLVRRESNPSSRSENVGG